MRLRNLLSLAAAASTLFLAAGGEAGAQADAWSRMAEEDLKAARAFVEETHPGSVPEGGDPLFIAQMNKGYADAQTLARTARTFGGYRAALERFAAAFDDPHIASSTWVEPDRFWPGFLISSRRGGWKVVPGGMAGGPEAGAELISCDGKAPDDMAAAALAPFTAAWKVRAQQMRNSSSLLIDSGNPHQARAAACDFRSPSGTVATYRLDWRRIDGAELGRQFANVGRAAAGDVGMRPFEGGWWIRLGTLSQAALPLMKEAQSRRSELRAAPFVVVDLRGNGGGASFISDRIAEAIFGTARVDAALYPSGAREPQKVVWRATARTLSTAEAYAERAARIAAPDDPVVLGMSAQRDAVRAAVQRGAALAEGPAAVDKEVALRKRDRVRRPPRVILITDRICFSSCLQAARLFRALGAIHGGQETNANTRYSNVISADLPSGLSNFSSLQAYSTYVPRQLGPYTPSVAFDVDLADDAAVERKVRELIAGRAGRR